MRSWNRVWQILFVLIGVIVVLGPAGCGSTNRTRHETWQFRRAVEELSRSRGIRESQPASPSHARPVVPAPKPTKSVEDSDERHPSRWKRKLKAAYA